jgi:hypothetical protein
LLKHGYLGMTIDFSVKGKVMITMIDFIEQMLEEIPEDMKGEKQSPAQDHLFKVYEEGGVKLEETKRAIAHRNTAKLLFLSQRARPDVQTATSLPLILGAEGSGNIY